LAAYEWRDTWRDLSSYDRTLVALKNRCVSSLHIDITRVAQLVLSSDKAGVEAYARDLKGLLEAAAERGIEITAEAGDPEWSSSRGVEAAQAVLAFVTRYNSEASGHRIVGVDYDVEPWGLPRWRRAKYELLSAYLEFVRGVVRVHRRLGFSGELGFAIPAWFDGQREAVGMVGFEGEMTYPYTHLIRLLAPIRAAHLVVMAYRDTAAGDNGTAALFRGEIESAEAREASVGLWLAQDVSDSHPRNTTYYGKRRNEFFTDLSTLAAEFGDDDNFKGLIVNDVASLLALRD
jgi:hypothetical protein